jgi:hypothetical protein
MKAGSVTRSACTSLQSKDMTVLMGSLCLSPSECQPAPADRRATGRDDSLFGTVLASNVRRLLGLGSAVLVVVAAHFIHPSAAASLARLGKHTTEEIRVGVRVGVETREIHEQDEHYRTREGEWQMVAE